MAVYTYQNVRVDGAVSLSSVTDLELDIQPNHHGRVRITGIVPEDAPFSGVEASREGTRGSVLARESPRLQGVKTQAEKTPRAG